jgi:hypothetical protein
MLEYIRTHSPHWRLHATISITSPSFLRACVVFTLLTVLIIGYAQQIDMPAYLSNLLALVIGTLFEAMPPAPTKTAQAQKQDTQTNE